MLQAFDITGDDCYFEEARRAILSVQGLEFSLGYQFNNTAWGAVACARLWKLTGDPYFLSQGDVFLASFFHNTFLWESNIGHAQHYPTFLGVTCLHDGDYMAAYEEFEAFSAFLEYLSLVDGDIRPSVRTLLTEYYRHTLSRAWYYYPESLPEEAIATEVRNGHIERGLAIPVEDLYADGSQAGAVGQEIYGCGSAFVYATRAFRREKGVPFTVFCDYPICSLERSGANRVEIQLAGNPDFPARLLLIGDRLPEVAVCQEVGGHCAAVESNGAGSEVPEYTVKGGAKITIEWPVRRSRPKANPAKAESERERSRSRKLSAT